MEHLKIPAHGISIHALLAESDISVFWTALSRPLFLSTLSLRRATRFFDVSLNYFYPRSPCGERLNKRCEFNGDNRFLSTLSLRRATVSVWCFCGGAFGFLSTLSLRRATADAPQDGPQLGFLSTLSLRRATIPDREPAAGYLISIHALLAESDPTRWAPTCRISNFYPRSPCGERPEPDAGADGAAAISIHALLAESDDKHDCCILDSDDFYPRSPCGERQFLLLLS